MKTSALLAAMAISLIAPSANAALQQGDAAPDFTTQASLAGKEFTFALGDALKRGPVVIYFYPAAFSEGCNIQAHTFAVNYDKFTAAGATVVGVSLDSIARLNDFSADPQYCAGKLPVASDVSGAIAKSYGIKIIDSFKGHAAATFKDTRGNEIGHSFVERVTFVVVPGSKITTTIGGVSPADNVQKALAVVQQLAATNRNAQ